MDTTSEIRDFLTSRRARIKPEEVGLTSYGPRRVPGLRREEVATLAGVSVDYYNREDPRVQGQFDVAGLGLRQSGSAYKPFTYSQAFASRQATLSTFLMDTLTEFGQHGQSYRPRNADRTEST
jgi:membrane peptidoglycan carboxypeptidase